MHSDSHCQKKKINKQIKSRIRPVNAGNKLRVARGDVLGGWAK